MLECASMEESNSSWSSPVVWIISPIYRYRRLIGFPYLTDLNNKEKLHIPDLPRKIQMSGNIVSLQNDPITLNFVSDRMGKINKYGK